MITFLSMQFPGSDCNFSRFFCLYILVLFYVNNFICNNCKCLSVYIYNI